MKQQIINFSGGFLYFPKDKSLYIPAAIEFGILMVIVFATFYLFRKISARQAEKAQHLEERALQERNERMTKEKK